MNNRIGSVTDREMQQIDIALQIALKLDAGADTKEYVENQSGGASREQMIRLEAERDTYKKLYEDIMNRRR